MRGSFIVMDENELFEHNGGEPLSLTLILTIIGMAGAFGYFCYNRGYEAGYNETWNEYLSAPAPTPTPASVQATASTSSPSSSTSSSSFPKPCPAPMPY